MLELTIGAAPITAQIVSCGTNALILIIKTRSLWMSYGSMAPKFYSIENNQCCKCIERIQFSLCFMEFYTSTLSSRGSRVVVGTIKSLCMLLLDMYRILRMRCHLLLSQEESWFCSCLSPMCERC